MRKLTRSPPRSLVDSNRVISVAQGVTLAGRVDDLDEQIKTKNNKIRDNRAVLQRNLPPGMTVEAFNTLPEDAPRG